MAPSSTQPPEDATHAKVTFHPQVPTADQLVEPDDTWTYNVPIGVATDEDGAVYPDDSSASDSLARHENAPEIAQRWTELTGWYFRVTVDEFVTTDS
jgi:hypothetical protein